MQSYADKNKESKAQPSQKKDRGSNVTPGFADNRPGAIANRKLKAGIENNSRIKQLRTLQDMANNGPKGKQADQLQAMAMNRAHATLQRMHHPEEEEKEPPQKKTSDTARQRKDMVQGLVAQRKDNNTGLPDTLKSGIETLSGYAMDDVKVYYNSGKPMQLNASAYAQGTAIHLAPGQEKHLPHEAWHVVQQKQGRVKPLLQMKDNVNINDDVVLEKEADVMGARAIQKSAMPAEQNKTFTVLTPPVQLKTSSKVPEQSNDEVIQPVWINYRLGSILMWDKNLDGIRWYYLVKEKKMYFSIENLEVLKKILGVAEEDSESEKVKNMRERSGMENAKPRNEWIKSGLFGDEENEPEPAPVVSIEEVSRHMTRNLQPEALGNIKSLESNVNSISLLSSPVEQTPLFTIIHRVAKEQNMSVWELELRLGSPEQYYQAYLQDRESSGKQSGLRFENLEVSSIKTFKEYAGYLIQKKKLTGSCGQTSSWIHRITGGLQGKNGGQETALTIDDFIGVLKTHKSKPFYMRVLTGGHSFIIESSGKSMAIYQSWHGAAPMAFMLEKGLDVFKPGVMIEKLREVLTPKDSMMGQHLERMKTGQEVFYGQEHKDPTPLIWFNINLNPLAPEQIAKNIQMSLGKYKGQWEYALSGKDMEKMNVPEEKDKMGPEFPPKDMRQVLKKYNLDSDLHKGLTNLHQQQIELKEGGLKSKEEEQNVPDSKLEYKSTNQYPITSNFTIDKDDFDSPPSSTMMGIMTGLLKTKIYIHKKNNRNYKMTKSGEGRNTVYTFTLTE